jgi:hypothetical protein
MDPKKRSVGASERDELFLRAPWRLMVAGQTHTERLVFVDECSTNTSLAPLWHPSTLGPGQESERFVRCRATGGLRSPSVGEHERGRDGPVPSGRRPDHEGGLRDLPGASVGALAEARASDRDGQPLFTQGTRARGSRRSSSRGAASWFTCRPTRPISTPSKKPSPSSRRCYAKPAHAPARL